MKALKHLCALIVLACSCITAQAASEVIQLNYRMAQDVLPVVQSVLGQDGRATAYGSQLIVNASPEKLIELRSVLEQIDTQPRRLLITVDSQGNQHNREHGYQVDGTLGGRYGELVIGEGERDGRDQARIIRNTTQNRDGSVRTVQTLEGSAVLVQVGQDIPQHVIRYGPYGQVTESTQYHSVNQGFYVTATVHGDTVQVELSSQNDRLNQGQHDVIDTQSLASRFSGRVGEWINVGGGQEDSTGRQTGFLQKRYSSGRVDNQIQIKIDVLD